MENLNRRIKREMALYSSKSQLSNELLQKINSEKKQLYSDYEIWIDNLKNYMRVRKYRTVIGEIESKKHNFKRIQELHWKYQYLEIDAIFKLLKKKIWHHKKDIPIENSHQYHSCIFWFNQIFLILEQILLELRPDLNSQLNYKKTNIIKPIQCIIDSYVKFCFLLLIFSHYNQQIPDILSYLSIIDKIVPYMKFTVKSSSYLYMQKIQLFKVKILTENCDYLNAINSLESNIDFCYDYIKLLSDHKFNVYIFDIKDEKNRKYLENLKKKRLFKIYQYKGFIKQNENEENKINKQNLKFKNKKSLIALNQQKLKYIEILNNINQNRTKKNINKNKITNLGLKKNNSNISNFTKKTNSTNNNKTFKFNQSETQTTIATQSMIQIKNIKNKIPNNKNMNKTKIVIIDEEEDDDNKGHLLLKGIKHMKKNKKVIIEEVLSNMALNFYLRGALFENFGNIDSALDSYKEVEWLSIKFLGNKFPAFAKYMSSLLNCAWNNYNIIYNIKYEKVKLKKKKEILKDIEMIKKQERFNAQENKEEKFQFKSDKLFNDKKLNSYLTELGNKIYKEEEQRNFNIYNNFTKKGYILSTYNMVNDLLSDEFRPILKNMSKVEVTKPNDDIKDQIDKALIKRQHQYTVKENESIKNNNLIKSVNNIRNIISKDNTKESSININQSNNLNHNNKLKNKRKSYKQYKLSGKYFMKKLLNTNKKLNWYSMENSFQKNSTTCEISISNNNLKKSSSIYPYKDIINRQNKKFLNKSKVDNKNVPIKFRNKNYRRITKGNSAFLNLRSFHKKEKVENYFVDKDNFSKKIMEKKIFLDKFSRKEFIFLNNLLKTKYSLEEVVNPIDDLELKKVRHDADLSFNTKLEIAKSQGGKKILKNLIEENLDIETNNKNKRYIQNDSETPSEQSEDNNKDNNEKLKQIENEYNKIIVKRNKLIKIKNSIMNPTSKSLYI